MITALTVVYLACFQLCAIPAIIRIVRRRSSGDLSLVREGLLLCGITAQFSVMLLTGVRWQVWVSPLASLINVVVLTAGTGHKRVSASRDLLIVGAYPATGSYDEPKPADIDHAKALAAITRVPAPAQDPVYGKRGPLVELWRRA